MGLTGSLRPPPVSQPGSQESCVCPGLRLTKRPTLAYPFAKDTSGTVSVAATESLVSLMLQAHLWRHWQASQPVREQERQRSGRG